MLLKDKVAVIYGAAGAVGGAVSLAFAAEGAKVYLAGRTEATLQAMAAKIKDEGGKVEVIVADAFDKEAVERSLQKIVEAEGRIDISFNLISTDDIQGKLLTEMDAGDFLQPIHRAMNSHFITATAAARLMKTSGVIMALTANAAKKPYPTLGGFGVACAAIEGFCRQLAFEVGERGIRVVCLRSAGSPDSPGVDEVFNLHAGNAGLSREEFDRNFAADTMLKRLPLLREVADAAVLMASDKAGVVTAAVLNVTCGELAD
jgi:3-oxoacyl-[acyl-carrier protein] reductase